MRLACGFVDIGSRLRNPVMLQIPPMTTHCIAMHVANVVMSSHHGAGETFQNDAESPGRDVKAAGLKPDTIRIRNPETIIVEAGIGNEMFAVPPIRIETVGETVKCSYRHRVSFFFVSKTIEIGIEFGVNAFPNLIWLRRR